MNPSFTKFMVLVTVILMDVLGGAELDLFVPSFPELQTQFGLSPFWVEALLSVNFIGFFLSLFFVGSLADRHGRKPIILWGILIFIIGSSLCLWATSYPFLLGGRFLQGIGIAGPATLCFLIIADAYPLKEQQFLMAMLNGVMNAAVGAAPVVGSYIALYFHWQGSFVVLLCSGVVVGLMTIFFIPKDKLPEKKETLSLGGYMPLFRSRPLMLVIVHIVFLFVPYWIFAGMSPLLYMQSLGVTLSQFGYYQGALATAFALGSVVFGFIINRYEQKKLLSLSAKLSLFGFLCIALVTFMGTTSPLLITLAFLAFITVQIIPGSILYPLCISFMPKAKGKVSAVVQGLRLLLSAVVLQVAGYFYTGTFRSIGVIILCFILVTMVTSFFVIRNRELMDFSEASN
ncbi:MAG TPA: MFS transporter [Holosporales bacterium]|nr:MFS transporter [Holosporales bacterium]